MILLLPGLRGKFVAALLVASLVPLVIGIVVLQTVGFGHLLAERGALHETEARGLSRSLDLAVAGEAGKFRAWLVGRPAITAAALASPGSGAAEDARIRAHDEAWPGLPADDPRVAAVVASPAADELRGYLELSPGVAEILVADARGRVVTSTNKPSDYDQSDEAWWQTGRELAPDGCWSDVLHLDESAEVYSIDFVVPLYQGGRFAGVAKIVVEVSSLFERLDPAGGDAERVEVILDDGTLVARPSGGGELGNLVLDDAALMALEVGENGWTTLEDQAGDRWMTGFAALQSSTRDRRTEEAGGYVLFSSPRAAVVGPVRRQLGWVGLGAGVAALGCAFVGYWLVHHGILRPLETLRRAANAVAGSARLHLGSGTARMEVEMARREAEADLSRIQAIRTGDEVEDLAADIGVMTSRVLRYQRELEAEVDAKTSVIREDLELAREFQHALLPADYPESADAGEHRLRLGFSHYYEPSSTVGGDFFDLFELDDGRIGVLIADVMGHGARSALVTAILRALVHNHAGNIAAPGEFLAILNGHLHDMIHRSGQSLFVSAFFMMLDPGREEYSWAVAGHPAPVKARRGSGRHPDYLWRGARHQTALGLVAEADYESNRGKMVSGDVFILYTDGLVEAESATGEEFGPKRLLKAVDQALDGPLAAMPAQIVCEVSAFQQSEQYSDDVCVVAVEVSPNHPTPIKPVPALEKSGRA